MGLSNYLQETILNYVFEANATSPAKATIYVGLSTSTPNEDGTGVTEPSGSGYARVAVTSNTTNWTAAAASGVAGVNGSSIGNATAVTFPTASGSWGTVTYVVLYDALTAGNYLGAGVLSTAQSITTGDTFSLPIGDLVISIN